MTEIVSKKEAIYMLLDIILECTLARDNNYVYFDRSRKNSKDYAQMFYNIIYKNANFIEIFTSENPLILEDSESVIVLFKNGPDYVFSTETKTSKKSKVLEEEEEIQEIERSMKRTRLSPRKFLSFGSQPVCAACGKYTDNSIKFENKYFCSEECRQKYIRNKRNPYKYPNKKCADCGQQKCNHSSNGSGFLEYVCDKCWS